MLKIKNFHPIKLCFYITFLYAFFLLINAMGKHYSIVNHPYQLDYREVANLLDTKALLAGKNPYALENQPDLGTCYGIGYSLVCVPFSKIFGANLFSHRLVSVLSIFGTCLFFFLLLRREKIDAWLSFTGSVILYLNLSFNNQSLCRPDGLGMLFFSISVFLPIYYKYSTKSLVIALLFSILSFYVKQYYILGFSLVIIYVFLFHSIKKGIVYGGIYLSLFILSVYIVKYYFESYFYSTTLAMYTLAVNKFNWTIYQYESFFTTHLGLTIVLLVSLIVFVVTNSSSIKYHLSNFNFASKLENYFNIKSVSQGFLTFKMNVYAFLFLTLGFLILIKLGGNDGAYMAYYFQLLSFSYIALVLCFTIIYPNSKIVFVPFLLLSLFFANTMSKTWPLNQADINDWKKVSNLVKKSKDILNTPAISYELVLHNHKIYDTGLNCHWVDYRCDPNTFPGRMVSQTYRNIDKIQAKIKNKKFDVLILDAETKWTHSDWYASDSLIELYYDKTDSVNLKMFQTNQLWPVDIWTPKK